jgi:hypothetical protein
VCPSTTQVMLKNRMPWMQDSDWSDWLVLKSFFKFV